MSKEINILYSFDEKKSSYKVLQLFTKEGNVSSNLIEKIYNNFRSEESTNELLFSSLEELGRFSIEILEASSEALVYLLSTSDYNIGLDSCNTTSEFRDIFKKFGTSIYNPDLNGKKTSILSKIFK